MGHSRIFFLCLDCFHHHTVDDPNLSRGYTRRYYLFDVTPRHLYCKLFNRVTQWVPLLKQELLTLSESSEFTIGFSGVRDTQSLVFCVVLCRLFICCPFSLSHCIFCPSCHCSGNTVWSLQYYISDNTCKVRCIKFFVITKRFPAYCDSNINKWIWLYTSWSLHINI
jgi:hypothetical protein